MDWSICPLVTDGIECCLELLPALDQTGVRPTLYVVAPAIA
jgi:hypothetical protein